MASRRCIRRWGAPPHQRQQRPRPDIAAIIGGVVPTQTAVGYLPEDVDLDGVVKYTGANNDRDVILQNIGGTVPTNVRVEQLPEHGPGQVHARAVWWRASSS